MDPEELIINKHDLRRKYNKQISINFIIHICVAGVVVSVQHSRAPTERSYK